MHTRVDGWVERLATKASGDPVQQGQLLFELYSPTLVNAQQEFLAALRSNNSVLLNASKDRLQALGVTDGEIEGLQADQRVRQRVRVYAQSDGVIAHLGVREGIFVTPADEVMSIARLDRVWVIAEVFEAAGRLGRARAIGPRRTRLPARPDLGGDGRLRLPGTRSGHADVASTHPASKTKTRCCVRTCSHGVTISGDATDDVVHIPREALIRGGASDRVVLALGEGRFRSQIVTGRCGIRKSHRDYARTRSRKSDRDVWPVF